MNCMRLILLGAPGAGKGTQAEILSEKLGIPTISTGNILRAAMKNGTQVGLKAKEFVDIGKLVPDELIIEIIKERLANEDCKSGYILDGVPRTINQAVAMNNLGVQIDKVLLIDVEDKTIVERMSGRRTCGNCSRTYHLMFNPPENEGVCDVCGGELITRKDDAHEVVLDRLVNYHRETEPLVDFYAKENKLITIHSRSSIEDTTDDIIKSLEI